MLAKKAGTTWLLTTLLLTVSVSSTRAEDDQAEECSSKGGTNDGSCASGFGVCCTFKLSCGSSASENQTYLIQTAVTTLTSPCTYTICKCSTNICRIRFDFTTFVLASAVAGTAGSNGVPA